MPSAPTPPAAPRQRLVWVDVLRGTLVLIVVVYHCCYGAISVGAHAPEQALEFVRALEPVRMPVLVMLSGMFLPRALAKGTRRYVTGKLSALVAPYVGWFLLFYFVLLAGTHRPTDHWYVEIVVPQTPLWFICYLIGFFALALLLRTPEARALALVGALWLVHTEHDTDWHFWFYFGCFLVGSLVADPPRAVRTLTARLTGAPLIALSVLAAWPATRMMHSAVVHNHTDRTVSWLLYAVCALLAARTLALVVAPTRIGRWLAALGPYTIVIFLTHTALFAAFPDPSRSLSLGAIDSWWLSLAMAFGLSLGCVAVVRRHEGAWILFDVRRGYRALTTAAPRPRTAPPSALVLRSESLRAAPDLARTGLPADWLSLR